MNNYKRGFSGPYIKRCLWESRELWTFLFLSKNDFCEIIFFHVTEKKSGFLLDLCQSSFSVDFENIFLANFYFFVQFGFSKISGLDIF
jgi:hypothetical protein